MDTPWVNQELGIAPLHSDSDSSNIPVSCSVEHSSLPPAEKKTFLLSSPPPPPPSPQSLLHLSRHVLTLGRQGVQGVFVTLINRGRNQVLLKTRLKKLTSCKVWTLDTSTLYLCSTAVRSDIGCGNPCESARDTRRPASKKGGAESSICLPPNTQFHGARRHSEKKLTSNTFTGDLRRMSHRKWRETKQLPSRTRSDY